MSNILLAMDAVIAMMEITAKYNQMISRARIEGRDITKAELRTLRDENKLKRAVFEARRPQ